jgi:hypothetical protein
MPATLAERCRCTCKAHPESFRNRSFGTGRRYTLWLEVTRGFLAITLLGLKFSGTLALGVVPVVVVVVCLAWFRTTRRPLTSIARASARRRDRHEGEDPYLRSRSLG